MFIRKKEYKTLEIAINKLNKIIQTANIQEISYIIGNKKEILKRNLIAGISRGVGIGIGITVVTAIIVYILQRIVTLNIPVIGEFIADIIEIVEKGHP